MGTFGLGGEDRDRRFCGILIFLSLFLIFLFSFASSLATEEEEVRDRLGN